jgi:hypothetical protein
MSRDLSKEINDDLIMAGNAKVSRNFPVFEIICDVGDRYALQSKHQPMKSPIRNVTLSFSCPEKWESLVDVGDNKYCQKCNHLVVDFTRLTQEEFDDAAKKNPGRLCGRFKPSQMRQPVAKYAAITTLAASVLVLASCNEEVVLPANAKDPAMTEETIELPSIEVEEELLYTTGIVFYNDSLSMTEDPDTFNHVEPED